MLLPISYTFQKATIVRLCTKTQKLRKSKHFPVASYEDSEGREVMLDFLLWHSAQQGRQNWNLYATAALYPQRNSLVLISVIKTEWAAGKLNAGRRNR